MTWWEWREDRQGSNPNNAQNGKREGSFCCCTVRSLLMSMNTNNKTRNTHRGCSRSLHEGQETPKMTMRSTRMLRHSEKIGCLKIGENFIYCSYTNATPVELTVKDSKDMTSFRFHQVLRKEATCQFDSSSCQANLEKWRSVFLSFHDGDTTWEWIYSHRCWSDFLGSKTQVTANCSNTFSLAILLWLCFCMGTPICRITNPSGSVDVVADEQCHSAIAASRPS